MNDEIQREIRTRGAVVTRRELGSGRFDHLCRRGVLVRVQPGVAVLAEHRHLLAVRARAAMAVDPDAVITGRVAAALTWCSDLESPGMPVEASAPRPHRGGHGYLWSRRRIPPELVTERSGTRLVCPELSVLQLIPQIGSDVVDEALRRCAVTLDSLTQALEHTMDRPGNALCRSVLADSRDEPWSYAERRAHRVLRAGGITGWRANLPVRLRRPEVFSGRIAFLDIGFARLRLGIEIDGLTYHCGPAAMEHDRRRDVALALEGWMVTRFPAGAVDDPGWSRTVAELLRARRLQLGLKGA